MKTNLSSLIKKVFLSSIAGILANNSSTAVPIFDNTSLKIEDKEQSRLKFNDLTPKLILKQNKNSELMAMAHRSHRSHSSHRSHYSSTSGSPTRSSSSSSRSSSSNSSSSNNSNSSNSSTPSNFYNSNTSKSTSGISVATLSLGDRNLKLGMSGSDVTQLINILIKKGYLKLENGDTTVSGNYTYDETIVAVVKKFQRDNGLESDGECGPTTTYYLKN